MKKIFFLRYLLVILLISNCTKVHRGYKIEDDTGDDIIKMVEQKANIDDFVNKFGSPSFINSPINNTICYTYAVAKNVAFNRFYKPIHQYICIKFDSNNLAESYEQKTLKKIKKVKMNKFQNNFVKPL